MIAEFKRYIKTENGFIESNQGSCLGAEWIDENENIHRMICIRFPAFNLEGQYAETLYKVQIQPKGLDIWAELPEVLITITKDKFVLSNPMDQSTFGKRCTEPLDENGQVLAGVSNQVQFFSDIVLFNIYSIPASFIPFIKNDIVNTCGVTFA
jgi:hypothetical protein